jgi:hypothetical protein
LAWAICKKTFKQGRSYIKGVCHFVLSTFGEKGKYGYIFALRLNCWFAETKFQVTLGLSACSRGTRFAC